MSALIPEWAPQEGVLLVWPHPYSDWADSLEQIEQSYAQMAAAITRHEQLLMVCYDDAIQTRALDLSQRAGANLNAIRCHQIKSNDTWARDFGPLTTIKENTLLINDFGFNGWGKKFDARLDNQINAALRDQKAFGDVEYESYSMILEGGSIECDGHGTLMTTSSCLLTDTRNPELSKEQLETVLKRRLGMEQVLWIENSFLAGDDTDGHIDMLARFAPGNTIVYVQCENKDDEHYTGFQAMEQELKAARNAEGKAYNLIALPFADAVYVDGDRLPLSYANYLIINDAVLVPQYGVSQDKQALDIIAQAHPGREMIAIDALPAIKQGGSIHCLSMQLPKGVLRP